MTAPKGAFWWSTIIKEVTVTVAPEFSVSGGGGWPGPLQIDVAPSFTFDGNGRVVDEFMISVPVQQWYLEGNQEMGGPFTITVPPDFSAAGGPGYPGTATISVPPDFDFAGVEQYTRTVTATLDVDFSFAGTGVNAVQYDAVGGGAAGYGNGSWSHTATAGAYVVLCAVADRDISVTSCTYDGSAMTLLGTATMTGGNSGNAWVKMYGKSNVAGGAKTAAISITAGGAYMCANTVSYTNVGSVGTPTAATGSGVDPSQSSTVTTGQRAVEALAAVATSGLISAFGSLSGGTSRSNASSAYSNLAILDSASSSTFSGDTSGTGVYGALNLILTAVT